MPSLKQLEEFQKSFLNMGREPEIMSELRQMPDNYPLPENEPSLPDPFEAAAAGFDADDGAGGGEPAGKGPADDFSPIAEDGELDFSAFLDMVPDDLGVLEPRDPAGKDAAPPEAPPRDDTDDLSVPPDLLDGFSGDIEEAAETAPGDTDMDFDLADFGENGGETIDMGGEAEGFDLSPGKAEEPGEVLPEETGDGGPDSEEFPDMDFEIPEAAFEEDAAPPDRDDIPAAEAPNVDLPDIGAEEDAGLADDTGGAEAAGGTSDAAPAAESVPPPEEAEDESSPVPSWDPGGEFLKDSLADSFENFDIESGAGTDTSLKPPEAGAGSSGAPGGVFDGIEDFDFSGIEDLELGSAVKMGTRAAEKGKHREPGAALPSLDDEDDKIEEINLSEEQYAKLLAALDSYPLNLKLAIEEIIVEQAVDPALMSALIKLLISDGSVHDAASLAEKILGRNIIIPKGFEKKTGEELEEEQTSFSYIFVHRFLPFAALCLTALLFIASLAFLFRQFVYLPLHAESIYRAGFERLKEGEYGRANDRFNEAFNIQRVKKWFYRYADAFQNERQYLYAEEKYDALLSWYPRDKKGALDYAAMETLLRNYPKAEQILRSNILEYSLNDRDGLLALGDNYLAWGEDDPARYEDARAAYARLLERYGWQDPIVERMLLYFIRTDNLAEVIPLQKYFDAASKRKISPRTLAEMGSYLLDKRIEEPDGVPDANVSLIEGLRSLLLRTVEADPALPEAHYNLARYYHDFGSKEDERITLERTLSAFDHAPEESSARIGRRVDAERRMADVLINAREFFKAEEHLVKGIGIFEDALERRRLSPAPEYGRLYAGMGDLEYFTKSGDMETALQFYERAEQNGWAPPEMRYRMGAARYQRGEWEASQEQFFAAYETMPLNRRLLHALGNVSYERGNFHAARGYYTRLLDLLETERARFPALTPDDRPDHRDLAERIMAARNNLGVTLEALTQRTGIPEYRADALGLYAESSHAWDILTRDPDTMIRLGAGEFAMPGINLAYLNSRNLLYPRTGYRPELYRRIDKDVLEPSVWEEIAPPLYGISGMQ
jgi:tetratricopeptide (TPR) repeat protein